MGETELPVGSRSSTSSLLNTAVHGKGKQYCTLSAMYLTFWSPWGITRLKSLPLPVVKAFPSNHCFEGTKMTSLHWKWDCGSHPPSSIWAEQDSLSLLQPHGHEERKEETVFPVLHLLVLSAAPDPRLGAGRLCQSRWMWGEEQGWRCRAPQPYHYAPDHKEERSLSLCGETQEYGHLPLKNHNIKEQLKKKNLNKKKIEAVGSGSGLHLWSAPNICHLGENLKRKKKCCWGAGGEVQSFLNT